MTGDANSVHLPVLSLGSVETGVPKSPSVRAVSFPVQWIATVYDLIAHAGDAVKLALCAGGIFVCYLLFGVYQEKV